MTGASVSNDPGVTQTPYFYRTAEVAAILGVPKRAVQQLAARGVLKTTKLSPHAQRLYHRDSVHRLRERMENGETIEE